MNASRPPRHARSGAPRRVLVALLTAVGVAAVALVVVAVALVAQFGSNGAVADGPSDPAAGETPPPLGAAQQLILDSGGNGDSCAVSFQGDGITDAAVVEQQGGLYQHLPIPRRDGAVFAGWYRTAADAAAFTQTQRVNGSRVVACSEQQQTLYGAWKTPAEVAAANVGVPILMYHQFTTNPNGESGSLRLNYTYIGDFDAQISYLAAQQFYLPTWPELSAFIDGALYLPQKSVIVTDDDADKTWLQLAVPVVDKYKVLTTSFVITKWRHEGTPSTYVLQRSHTNDMHDAGANGKGKMVNFTKDQIVADMETSAQILGAKEVMAYPFGQYNDTAKAALREAGFDMARTIENGYVRKGTDKLALPCIRIDFGESMAAFKKAVG
jgi:peptidoglycan/xylan/chitin deacetylase (PgdA/CDA1 family)